MRVVSGHCLFDLSENVAESIRCQTGLGVFNGKIIAYKEVRSNLTSFKDSAFKYVVGQMAVAENPTISNDGCANGLHFSNMNYWNGEDCETKDTTWIMVEIALEDVITVQLGKIRCKQAKVLGVYTIEKGEKQ